MRRSTPIFIPAASSPVAVTDQPQAQTTSLTQRLLNVVSEQGESTMTPAEKSTIATSLTGVTVALAALHNAGVKLGHFGSTDFIDIAETMLADVLPAFLPATPAAAAPAAS